MRPTAKMEFSELAGPVALGYSGDGRAQWIVDTLELGRGVYLVHQRTLGAWVPGLQGCQRVRRRLRARGPSRPRAQQTARCEPCSERFVAFFGGPASAPPAQDDSEGGESESEAASMGGYPAPRAASSAAAAAPQAKTKKSKRAAKMGSLRWAASCLA